MDLELAEVHEEVRNVNDIERLKSNAIFESGTHGNNVAAEQEAPEGAADLDKKGM